MVFLKRELEGYVRIDHKESPGFSDDEMFKSGTALARRGTVIEAPTLTCSHCERIVIINVKRTRERAHCYTCDHFICDACGAAMVFGKPCKTMKQRIADYFDNLAKGVEKLIL